MLNPQQELELDFELQNNGNLIQFQDRERSNVVQAYVVLLVKTIKNLFWAITASSVVYFVGCDGPFRGQFLALSFEPDQRLPIIDPFRF
jgi:hypothetical protein